MRGPARAMVCLRRNVQHHSTTPRAKAWCAVVCGHAAMTTGMLSKIAVRQIFFWTIHKDLEPISAAVENCELAVEKLLSEPADRARRTKSQSYKGTCDLLAACTYQDRHGAILTHCDTKTAFLLRKESTVM